MPPNAAVAVIGSGEYTLPNTKNLAALCLDERARLLYELVWRHSITFEYIRPWLSDALFEVASFDQPCALSKHQQMEIALALLNNARWFQADDRDKQQVIEERVVALIGMLERDAPYLPDCAAEIAYYHALVARDRLDYDGVTTAAERIVGEDPIWKLRKAALLAELGRSKEATDLVAQAYGELRENHRRDRQSLPILSQLLWAHWLLRAYRQSGFDQTTEALPAFAESNYRKWKCDPWSSVDELRQNVGEHWKQYRERRSPIEPQFEQGHYRDHSDDVLVANNIRDFLVLEGLSRTIGIPLRTDCGIGVDLLASDAEKIVLSGGTGVEQWDHTLAIRSASNEASMAIKGLFTRIGVACATQDAVDALVPRLLSAVTYWRQERIHGAEDSRMNSLSRLRVFLEVLARLAVRVSPAQAKELFLLATSLGQQTEIRHHWLYEVLRDLLTYTLRSIPESEQGELLSAALTFPLQHEIMSGYDPRWPNPVIDHIYGSSAKFVGRTGGILPDKRGA